MCGAGRGRAGSGRGLRRRPPPLPRCGSAGLEPRRHRRGSPGRPCPRALPSACGARRAGMGRGRWAPKRRWPGPPSAGSARRRRGSPGLCGAGALPAASRCGGHRSCGPYVRKFAFVLRPLASRPAVIIMQVPVVVRSAELCGSLCVPECWREIKLEVLSVETTERQIPGCKLILVSKESWYPVTHGSYAAQGRAQRLGGRGK